MRLAPFLTSFALTVAALPLGGCSGGDERRSTEPQAAAKVTRQFGYIRDIDLQARKLDFDRAQLLTGAEASAAARADGVIGHGDVVPNDYYIRNRERTFRVLPLAPEVRVTTAPCDPACRARVPGHLRGLAQSFHVPETLTLAHPYRGTHSQYWLTVRDGRVVAIDEQYLP